MRSNGRNGRGQNLQVTTEQFPGDVQLTMGRYAADQKLSTLELEYIVSKTDLLLQTHFRELPSYLRLPASSKLPMLPHVCLFQSVNLSERSF